MTLLGREIELQLGPPDPRNGRSYRDIRIDFKVEHTDRADPSSAVIEIYNVADESVAMAEDPASVVRLLAGYDEPRLVFTGNPVKDGVRLERRGPDRILKIEAQDGARAYQLAHLTISRAGEVSARTLIDAAAAELGLPSEIELGEARTLRDYAFAGPARQILDDLTKTTGSEWSIVDDVLVVRPIGSPLFDRAIEFSADRGNLVGSPVPTNEGVELVGLLEPTLRPRRRFVVKSERVSGVFRATDVIFEGSQWTQPFYVRLKGVAL